MDRLIRGLTSLRAPSVTVALAVVVLVGCGLTGCSRRSQALGAGEEVDVCVGHRVIESFPEPAAGRPDDVLAYAEGMVRVLDRIRPDLAIRREDAETVVPPPAVRDDIERMRIEVVRLRDAVDAGRRRPDLVRAAMNELATSEAYNGADARLSAFVAQTCRRRGG